MSSERKVVKGWSCKLERMRKVWWEFMKPSWKGWIIIIIKKKKEISSEKKRNQSRLPCAVGADKPDIDVQEKGWSCKVVNCREWEKFGEGSWSQVEKVENNNKKKISSEKKEKKLAQHKKKVAYLYTFESKDELLPFDHGWAPYRPYLHQFQKYFFHEIHFLEGFLQVLQLRKDLKKSE
jgi:hypothetical protein